MRQSLRGLTELLIVFAVGLLLTVAIQATYGVAQRMVDTAGRMVDTVVVTLNAQTPELDRVPTPGWVALECTRVDTTSPSCGK